MPLDERGQRARPVGQVWERGQIMAEEGALGVIGMTNVQEAKLAREAEICYATVGLVTDYDCWHEAEEAVTGQMVLENLRRKPW